MNEPVPAVIKYIFTNDYIFNDNEQHLKQINMRMKYQELAVENALKNDTNQPQGATHPHRPTIHASVLSMCSLDANWDPPQPKQPEGDVPIRREKGHLNDEVCLFWTRES